MRVAKFALMPAHKLEPGYELRDAGTVETVSRSGNDGTVIANVRKGDMVVRLQWAGTRPVAVAL